jgi:phosphoglycerate dehydrogenase-like enzyme
VILSPHSAGRSEEAAIRMAISTAKNVLAGIEGNAPAERGATNRNGD